MKRTATALFLTFAAAGAAQAQDFSNPTTLLPNFTFNNVAAVFSSVGAQPELKGQQGAQFLEIPTGEGGSVFAQLWACEDMDTLANCRGLVLYTIVDRGSAYDLETINKFNNDYYFIKTHRIENGAAILSRYLISDYGMPIGNIVVNAEVLVSLTKTFASGETGELTASIAGAEPAAAAVDAGLKAEAAAEVKAHGMKLESSTAFNAHSVTVTPE